MSNISEVLNKRSADSIGAILCETVAPKLVAIAPNDWGVKRNGGRQGAAFGPKCIVHAYKKFAQGTKAPLSPIQLLQVCSSAEQNSFEQFQKEQADNLTHALSSEKRTHLVHIGGGHDHAYPLLCSLLNSQEKNIHVINIDAHLDTRNDQHAHSGTPFRQFLNLAGNRARLTQIGIQDHANAASNWHNVNMNVHSFEKMEEQTLGFSNFDLKYLDQLIDINSNEISVFSLDLDAISAHEMPAVSAVNASGLPLMFVRALLKRYAKAMDEAKQTRILGLYEFNPIYDDVSGSSAKKVAGLIHLILN